MIFIKLLKPCIFFRKNFICVTKIVSSNQANLRHMKNLAYCCFLPDLTGFTSIHCVGPNYQHHFFWADHTKNFLTKDIRSCYSGLQVQGTANSPSSTAKIKLINGGESGTRTRGAVTALHAFQACPLANSDISPFNLFFLML